MKYLTFAASLLVTLHSVSMAASFDCTKAASLSEIAICSDNELSKLDDELAGIYRKAKSAAKDHNLFRQQTQAAWKWREENCRNKKCLLDWYAQRRLALLKISEASGSSKCLVAGPIKLNGFVVSQIITLEPSNKQSTVYLLNLKAPICVRVEPLDIGEAQDTMVNRFQLVSYENPAVLSQLKQKLFTSVTISGQLSTGNITQYYIESNAIDVRHISTP